MRDISRRDMKLDPEVAIKVPNALQNGDSLRREVLFGPLSPFWHQGLVKTDENEGKSVNSNSVQTIDR